jgi:hypothetical protein
MLRRGEPSELGAKVIELRDYRERLGEVEREIGETRGQIVDLQRAREAREQRMEALIERLEARQAEAEPQAPAPKSEHQRHLEALIERLGARDQETPEVLQGTDWRHRVDERRQLPEARLERTRLELESTTGMPHQFAQGDRVSGRLVDPVDLAGTLFARIEQEHGYTLVRWQSDMATHQGREVTIELEGGREVARALSILSREENQVIRPGPKPDLERDRPQDRARGPDLDMGF